VAGGGVETFGEDQAGTWKKSGKKIGGGHKKVTNENGVRALFKEILGRKANDRKKNLTKEKTGWGKLT